MQGRQGHGAEKTEHTCSVTGGVHTGTPLFTVKNMSLASGMLGSMKYEWPCLHSGELIAATGSSQTLLLASAQFLPLSTWEYVIVIQGKLREMSQRRRWMERHKFLTNTDLCNLVGSITHK